MGAEDHHIRSLRHAAKGISCRYQSLRIMYFSMYRECFYCAATGVAAEEARSPVWED
jgi:hypothetical protein